MQDGTLPPYYSVGIRIEPQENERIPEPPEELEWVLISEKHYNASPQQTFELRPFNEKSLPWDFEYFRHLTSVTPALHPGLLREPPTPLPDIDPGFLATAIV